MKGICCGGTPWVVDAIPVAHLCEECLQETGPWQDALSWRAATETEAAILHDTEPAAAVSRVIDNDGAPWVLLAAWVFDVIHIVNVLGAAGRLAVDDVQVLVHQAHYDHQVRDALIAALAIGGPPGKARPELALSGVLQLAATRTTP